MPRSRMYGSFHDSLTRDLQRSLTAPPTPTAWGDLAWKLVLREARNEFCCGTLLIPGNTRRATRPILVYPLHPDSECNLSPSVHTEPLTRQTAVRSHQFKREDSKNYLSTYNVSSWATACYVRRWIVGSWLMLHVCLRNTSSMLLDICVKIFSPCYAIPVKSWRPFTVLHSPAARAAGKQVNRAEHLLSA